MYIEKNIRYLRKDRGLSQEELGAELGVKNTAVSAYESGRNFPEFEKLLKLSEIFSVTLDELVFKNMEKEGVTHVSELKLSYTSEEKEKVEDRIIDALKAKVRMYADIIEKIDPGLLKELDDL